MDADVDHYEILGLPSGEEGMKLTLKVIEKAYRTKARQIHPDKNLNDPLAKSKFQQLQSSFQILKSETARKAFDDLIRAKLERVRRDYHLDAKRRKMVSDLEAREQASFVPDPQEKLRKQEEEAKKKFQKEIAKIREMLAKKKTDAVKVGLEEKEKEVTSSGLALNKKKILKVSWEKGGEEYDSTRLWELFRKFGEVEDVVIRTGAKKKRSALVVMASKEAANCKIEGIKEGERRKIERQREGEAALKSCDEFRAEKIEPSLSHPLKVAATQKMCGKLSNPLLVLPLEPSSADVPSTSRMINAVAEPPNLGHLVGVGYQKNEDSILEKLRKAGERQKEASKASKTAV